MGIILTSKWGNCKFSTPLIQNVEFAYFRLEWEKKFKRIFFFRTQGGVDVDGKDDLDSGDEAEGKKIDTEEVSCLD